MARDIGIGQCVNCKADVTLRLGNDQLIYQRCAKCKFNGNWGHADSKHILARLEKQNITKVTSNDEGGKSDPKADQSEHGQNTPGKPEEEKRPGLLSTIFGEDDDDEDA